MYRVSSVVFELNDDHLDRTWTVVDVGVHLSRRIDPEPHRRPGLQIVRVEHLAVLVYDLELAIRQRDERSPMVVAMQCQRLLGHDGRLPHAHLSVLELWFAS